MITQAPKTTEDAHYEPYETEEAKPTDEPNDGNVETRDPSVIGGGTPCKIHNFGYHYLPDGIIKYVGSENIDKWVKSQNVTSNQYNCSLNINIYECVTYFNIPDDVIIDIYINDYFVLGWNIEALLNRDSKAFEEYSKEILQNNYYIKLNNEMMLKISLLEKIKGKNDKQSVDYYNKISENGAISPYCKVTIADLVWNTSLSYEEVYNSLNCNNPDYFKYNVDLLFDDKEHLEQQILNSIIPEYESRVKTIDSLLHID